MALSGSISTSSYDGRIYTLSWSATQSIANNQSTISWTLSCSGGPQWIAERTLYVTLAGKVLVDKTARVERWAGTIDNGSFTVDHNTEGNYSFTGGIEVALYGSSVNRTISGSFVLDQIPRQATITSVMDFNDVTNPTVYFNHPAGSALELQACIMSGDTYITSYRRLTDEEIASGSYTFNLKEVYDDGTTPESRIWDRSIVVGSDIIDVTFSLATWLGNSFGYSTSKTKKCTVTDCEPTISPTIADHGSNSTRLTGSDSNKIIKGHNYLAVSTNAVGVKKASIVSQSISCNGTTIHAASGIINNAESNVFVFTATDNRGKTVTTTITKELINYEKLTCNLIIGNPTPDGELSFQIYGNYFDGNFGAVNNSLTAEYRLVVAGQNTDEQTWFRAGDNTTLDDIIISGSEPIITDNTYLYTMNVTGLDYRTTYIIQARAADEVHYGYLTSTERAVRCMPVFDWGPDDFKFNVPVNVNDSVEIGESVDINVPVNINDGAEISGRVNISGQLTKDKNPVGYYPVGGIYTSSTNINPGELFGGTWELIRSFYGGELLAYGTANNANDSNVEFDTASYHGISDIFGGGNVVLNLHNYIPDILTFDSGTIRVQTKGVVGLVEAKIALTGLTDANCYGIWFRSYNINTLPSTVILTGGGGVISVTKGNYTGASHNYFYNVADSDTGASFYVNPGILAYGGTFNPCRHGTLSVLQVKAFAKGGTTYMWKRIA